MDIGAVPAIVGGYFVRHAEWLLQPHNWRAAETWGALETLFYPWAVQFVMSWVGFTIYMVWDYRSYARGTLETDKLPSRHPIHDNPKGAGERLTLCGVPCSPFWYSQLFMVPLVLYNQLVVWPLVSLLVVWPQWAQNRTPLAAWSWPGVVGALAALMLVSDQMWYWSHRLMHTPYAWRALHKMHHVAPQSAISATYVHPWEYTLFTIAMQLPYAVAGFPLWVHAVPLGWGMLTGSGAHSGYSGEFANGDKHNAHHYYHNVNFGLLMIADMVFGTHWAPGDAPPGEWAEAKRIWAAYPAVHGSEAASTFTKGKDGGPGKDKAA